MKASRYEEPLHDEDEKYDRPSGKKSGSKTNFDELERGQRKDLVANEIELEEKTQEQPIEEQQLPPAIVPFFTHPDIIFDWRAVLGEFVGTMLVS